MKSRSLSAIVLSSGLLTGLPPVAAYPVTFTIDPTRSGIALSGQLTISGLGSYPIQAQGPGSLSTSYGGNVIADVTSSAIGFPGGSMVRANVSGTWQPAVGGEPGSSPADYGGEMAPPFTTVYGAARNLQIDLIGPSVPLDSGSFDSSLLIATFLTNAAPMGKFDFRATSSLPGISTNGSVLLTGSGTNSPSRGYLTNGLGLLTLVLPVNVTNDLSLGGYVATLVMQGQVVATATSSAQPFAVTVQVNAGMVTLTWPVLPGQVFTVQTTPDLRTSWQPSLGTVTVNDNTATWHGPAQDPAGFYRVVEQ